MTTPPNTSAPLTEAVSRETFALPPGVEVLTHPDRDAWLETREAFIGASEFPALVTRTHWQTPFGLWAIKTGRAPPPKDNAAMKKGRILEAAAIEAIADDHREYILTRPAPFTIYANPATGMSCTPDAFMTRPGRAGRGILQIKVVGASVFRKKWQDDLGNIIPPPHVVAQTLVEQMITGAQWACVGALELSEWRVDTHLIEIPMPPDFAKRAVEIAAEFIGYVRRGEPPKPDYGRDLEMIKAVYRDGQEPETDLERDPVLIAALDGFDARRATISAADKDKDFFESIIRERLGNAAAATAGHWRITAKLQHRREFTVKAGSSRPLRVTRTGSEDDE